MNQLQLLITLIFISTLTGCTPPLQRILESNECVNCDLSDLDFSSLGSLTGTDLSGATIEGVTISDFQFFGVNLSGANITSSTLQRVSFENSNLSGSIISDVTFIDSQISKSDLSESLIKARVEGVVYLGDTAVSSATLDISGDELLVEAIDFSEIAKASVSTDSFQLLRVSAGHREISVKSNRLTIVDSQDIILASLAPELDYLQIIKVPNVTIHPENHEFKGMLSGIRILNLETVKQLIVKDFGPSVFNVSATENVILEDWSPLEVWLSDSVIDKYVIEDDIVKRRYNEYTSKQSDWIWAMRDADDKRKSSFPLVMRDGFYPRFGVGTREYDKEVRGVGMVKWKRILKNLDVLKKRNYRAEKAAWDSLNKEGVILSDDAKRWLEIFLAGNVDNYLYVEKKAAFYSSNLQTCKSPTIPPAVAPSDVLSSNGAKIQTTYLFFRIPEFDSSVNAFMDCMNNGWEVFDSAMTRRDRGLRELGDALNGREQLAESLEAERQERAIAEQEAQGQAVFKVISSLYDIKDIVTQDFLTIYMTYRMTDDPLGHINFIQRGGWDSSEGKQKRMSIEKNVQTDIYRCISRSLKTLVRYENLPLLTTFSTLTQKGGKPTEKDAQAVQMPLVELKESMAEFMRVASNCVSSAVLNISTNRRR